ncbi:hypothetical protein [Kribbella deserti]|uniref:Uncharacterized protein n=1 Tax=Kribbella deserti TaxID=1926257 RepID=A0ABV6QXU5_9ACTN
MRIPENEVGLDLDDGGRWTSLQLGGREWFRTSAGGGDRNGLTTYVDSGGLDECFPTVRPDHGVLWNQPWGVVDEADEWDVVQTEEAVFLRRLNGGDAPDELGPQTIWADYRLLAEPGYRFIWAARASLDCEAGAQLVPDDLPAAELDGDTVLPGCASASVVDRGQTLRLAVTCLGQPTSFAIWRDGLSHDGLVVGPMLGRIFDLAEAGPADAAVVGPAGEITWRLTLSSG